MPQVEITHPVASAQVGFGVPFEAEVRHVRCAHSSRTSLTR